MSSSLIPERPLLISPTLAATIGLEEAVLLHVLSELLLQHPPLYRQQRRWMELGSDELLQALPFWSPDQVRRVQYSLQALGLIMVEPVPGQPTLQQIAINQPDAGTGSVPARPVAAPQPGPAPFQPTTGGATLIPDNWQPDATLLQQCQQRNIPREFVLQEVAPFVTYWQERRKPQYSWSNTFLKRVVANWEKQRSQQGAREQEIPMHSGWQPDQDALDILEHAGIDPGFIHESIPEFVLYWRERGTPNGAWSAKFIQHVRKQWERFMHATEHDTAPRPIPADFEPNPAVFDILAMQNIDSSFARAQIKAFILYWQDRNELQSSWNTLFLKHVKYQWTLQMQNSQPLLDKLGDRSWAES